jgi:hypothetical protein
MLGASVTFVTKNPNSFDRSNAGVLFGTASFETSPGKKQMFCVKRRMFGLNYLEVRSVTRRFVEKSAQFCQQIAQFCQKIAQNGDLPIRFLPEEGTDQNMEI